MTGNWLRPGAWRLLGRGCRSWLHVEPRHLTYEALHPRGHRAEPLDEILMNRVAVHRIREDLAQSAEDAGAVGCERVLEPAQGLHDSHCRAARPVEAARGS